VKVAELRQKLILEASTKSTIVIPEKVVKSLLNMASEDDFNTLVGFFESAGKVDLSRLPLAGNEGRRITVSSSPPSTPEPEYGSVYTAPDFGTDNNRFSR
jgi:hypothetical protein